MTRFARRTLPALLVVLVVGLVPTPAAQARPLSHNSKDVYASIDLHGMLHHFWTGLLSIFGADGAGADPNGKH